MLTSKAKRLKRMCCVHALCRYAYGERSRMHINTFEHSCSVCRHTYVDASMAFSIFIHCTLMTRETENSVSTFEFYRLFLTKSNGLYWDICWKLRKNNKKFTISTIYIYICPHFFYENLLFYITNILLTFLKLQKH